MKKKQKTHKGASKRFKVTRNGHVLHRSQYLSHLRSKKSKRRIRRLKLMKKLVGNYRKKILKLLGKK